MVLLQLTFPLVAVMVALPGLMPVTTPDELTAAIEVSELFQVTSGIVTDRRKSKTPLKNVSALTEAVVFLPLYTCKTSLNILDFTLYFHNPTTGFTTCFYWERRIY
jgi:hypothetical protein